MSIINDLVKDLREKGYIVDVHNPIVETKPRSNYPYSKTYKKKYRKPLAKI